MHARTELQRDVPATLPNRIFAIYDEPTGQILFLGRVTDPSAH
ncbi:MAG TPA: hypothetical protein VK509_11810 [Polyangiales bacterium]|nr:hypothetical protein [Polyangiales bacterium]